MLFPPLFPADFLLQICVSNLLLGNLTCKCSGQGRTEKAVGQLAVRAETQGHWATASIRHQQGCCCCDFLGRSGLEGRRVGDRFTAVAAFQAPGAVITGESVSVLEETDALEQRFLARVILAPWGIW